MGVALSQVQHVPSTIRINVPGPRCFRCREFRSSSAGRRRNRKLRKLSPPQNPSVYSLSACVCMVHPLLQIWKHLALYNARGIGRV